MLHKEFNNGLRAYPIHQAVQTIGSTAPNRTYKRVHAINATNVFTRCYASTAS